MSKVACALCQKPTEGRRRKYCSNECYQKARWTPEARRKASNKAWEWWGNHSKEYRNPELERLREVNKIVWSVVGDKVLYGRCKKLGECRCGLCLRLAGEYITKTTNVTATELKKNSLWSLLSSEQPEIGYNNQKD